MAQSQKNKTVEFNTTGVSYLGLGGKVGKFLIGRTSAGFTLMPCRRLYPAALD